MKKFIFLLFATIAFNSSFGQCKIDYSNFSLVFSQTFNGIDNSNVLNQLSNYWEFTPEGDPGFGWGDGTNFYSEWFDPSMISIAACNDPASPNTNCLRLKATYSSTAYNIWSTWLQTYRHPHWKSGMIMLKHSLTTSTPTNIPGHYFDGGYTSGSNPQWIGGFNYGIFEIRMKFPPQGDAWPALWLDGPSQINLIDDGGCTPRNFQVGYDNEWDGQNPHQGQGLNVNKLPWGDLSTSFHTYTVVWLPPVNGSQTGKMTFFLDGVEIVTYTPPNTLNPWTCANSIIVDLQMQDWNNSNPNYRYMDVEYIKVWKPTDGNWNVTYKSQKEGMNYNVFMPTHVMNTSLPTACANCKQVSTDLGSILPDPNNPNYVYYKDVNNRLRQAVNTGNNTWQVNLPNFNYNAPIPAALIRGDLNWDPASGHIIYKGFDNRLQYWGWQNGWFQDYIDQNWNTNAYEVSSNPGTLSITDDGNYFYAGIDMKMHRYYYNNGQHFSTVPYSYLPLWPYLFKDRPKGDVKAAKFGNYYYVFYKGYDNRLQYFKIDNNNIVLHDWVDPATSSAHLVSAKEGSITIGGWKEVFYIGQDNKIHREYFNGYNWVYDDMTYSYGSPSLGYTNADYARRGIAYDAVTRKVLYFGNDGRLQYFGFVNNWFHDWIDNYWGTGEFCSFNSANNFGGNSSYNPSIVWSPSNGATYYNGNFEWNNYSWQTIHEEKNLRYFVYDNCEILNPSSTSLSNYSRETNIDSNIASNKPMPGIYGSTKADLNDKIVYPNPSTDGIFNIFDLIVRDNATDGFIEVMGISGKIVYQNQLQSTNGKIYLKDQANGIYIVLLKTKESVFRQKVILQK